MNAEEKIATHYRTAFVFLACFILIHGLFGEDILQHKGMTFANEATRLLILSFIYKMPILYSQVS
ncbi:hypothetical protein ACOJUR_14525 [Alicyclobacillus tolerans]|uniref:DoxX family protein n=2 Tax=Alicyclobacillus tolerans TaxID=90970 RepID=A0ABT9LUM8_9BACL|nr:MULTISPECIES: hypothetical protein [Alicyclobacillus]MDP9727981.1 hypothetical protein [Alicyclobacillus tengchongensis]QRF24271.1 hypothetical protein FY534_12030 [Alicyclobacillus sp. TC]SHL13154.1 hypothetical protein SAMN05443507_1428 [Alicyclobacillus montanus]